MAKSTARRARGKAVTGKPPKPRKDFPLFPHATGRWAKKIKGRLYYFGQWGTRKNKKLVRVPGDGWKEAEALYERQRADLYAGREPQSVSTWQGRISLCRPTIHQTAGVERKPH